MRLCTGIGTWRLYAFSHEIICSLDGGSWVRWDEHSEDSAEDMEVVVGWIHRGGDGIGWSIKH